MAHSSYPEEVQRFIADHSEEYSRKELSEELKARFNFEKTPEALHSWCKARRLKSKPRSGRQCPELSKYPAEMHTYIREIAYGRGYKEIAQMVNDRFGEGTISFEQVRYYLKNHKIKTGRTGYFHKGHVPWTKSKRIEEIIKDPEKRKRCEATRYKKGNVPINTLPVGAVVVNTEGYYIRKKQMEGSRWERWEFLHRAVWEEHNGPIPEGMLVSFKDSNPLHCDIDNLMLISKAEHAAMNNYGYRTPDPELTMAGLAVVRIDQKRRSLIKDRRKSNV